MIFSICGTLSRALQTLSFEKGFDPKELEVFFGLDLFRMMTTKTISIIPVGPLPTPIFILSSLPLGYLSSLRALRVRLANARSG